MVDFIAAAAQLRYAHPYLQLKSVSLKERKRHFAFTFTTFTTVELGAPQWLQSCPDQFHTHSHMIMWEL